MVRDSGKIVTFAKRLKHLEILKMNIDLGLLDIMLPEPDPNAREKVIERCTKAPTAYENWAPAVALAGVAAPATVAVPLSFELQEAILENLDLSPECMSNLQGIVREIEDMGARHGFPLFIKTSFTSNKHEWATSCCLESADPDAVLNQLANIVGSQGFSPYPISASLLIREMLDTAPAFHAFEGMPVTQEFRFFAGAGRVDGYQPYWPAHSIQNPSVEDWAQRLEGISKLKPADLQHLIGMASAVTSKLEGDWSVDFLKDRQGKWWLIDMAEGALSYRNESAYRPLSKRQEVSDTPGLG